MLDLVGSYSNCCFEEAGQVVTTRLPTVEDRAKIESRLRQIGAILQPASGIKSGSHRLALAITSMLAGYLNAKVPDPKATTAAYVAELSRYPAWAVERACRAVGSGQVAGLSPDFPPSAPRLAQIAQTYLEEYHAERARIQIVLGAKLAYVPSPGERERIHDGFLALKETIKPKPDPAEVRRKAERDARAKEANEADVRRARAAAGLQPTPAGALLVSPSLLKTLPQSKPVSAEDHQDE